LEPGAEAAGGWRPGAGVQPTIRRARLGIDAHGRGDARRRHAVPRVLGLSTSTLYSISVTQIPLLHRKVEAVLGRAGFERASHDAKDLLTILENYPRDELLQIGEDELYQTAMGILGLQERQRLRLFIRRERFGRYFSCLVFLPRDRLNTDNRVAIQRILLDALGGVSIEYQYRLSESVLARIHLIVRIEPGDAVDHDTAAIEHRLAQAIRSWTDDLADALVEEFGEHRSVELFHRYREAFPAGYRADFPARMGAVDIRHIEAHDGLSMNETQVVFGTGAIGRAPDRRALRSRGWRYAL
jgi:glutamate dehydrogenase